MLIHGARAVVRIAPTKNDYRHKWVQALRERRGVNRTIVAVANKNARIIWSVLAKNEHYRAAA
jgi:transposase